MSKTFGRMGMLAVLAVLALSIGAGAGERHSPNAKPVFMVDYGYTNPDMSTWDPLDVDAYYANAKFYNSASGEFFADVMTNSLSIQRAFRGTLPSIANYSQTAHMQNGGEDSLSAACGTSYCSPGVPTKWVMWDTPFMMRETHKRDDGYLGYEQTVSGFATGISRLLGETTAIGLAVGYDYRKMNARDGYHFRERADTFHAALYGGTAIGCFFVDAYAGYSRSWQRTNRNVYWGVNDIDNNTANFNDTVLSAGLKASYVWILPNEFRITPAIGLDYSYVTMGSFTENGTWSGGGASASRLRVRSANHHSLVMPVTVSVNKTYSADFLTFRGKCSLWTPEIRAGWVPQFGSKNTSVNANFKDWTGPGVDSPVFTSRSSTLASSYGTVGAGLKIKLADKYIFAVDYDYTFASKYNNHKVTATYGVSF